MENFITKDKSYKPSGSQVKCSSGAVFDASYEPLLPEILTDYYAQRKKAQNLGKDAEVDLVELQKILKERELQGSNALN